MTLTERTKLGCLLAVLIGAAVFALQQSRVAAIDARQSPAAKIAFDHAIQPILARRCLQCHGPAKASGGLRLTDRDAATVKLKSGERAIVPGKPEESALVQRIEAADPNVRMPPKHEPVTATEAAILKQWIAEGAAWPMHWAYRPLERPPVPAIDGADLKAWPKTPIDNFVLAKLRDRGLKPAREADRRTLLRRVTFDLLGLPPTPEEIAAFLADNNPDAYEKVIDRLLASPHYGERWARHWMDVVHFAETHGHDQDRPRPHAWPYRDYLIRSFNSDKPFARFLEEQIAGDVLYPDDPQTIVATGFLAAGPWDESSLRDIREDSIDREIGRYLDRDDVLTTALGTFASASVHCARCHDHKFDPISQREYYALQAVFAGVDKGDRPVDEDPQIAKTRHGLLQRKVALAEQRERKDRELLSPVTEQAVLAWEQSRADVGTAWTLVTPASMAATNGSKLRQLSDGSILAEGERPATDTYTATATIALPRVTGVRLEVLKDDSLPHKGPGRQDNGNLHLNEFQVLVGVPGGRDPGKALALRNPRADFNQQGWSVDMALDGKPATAWGIYPEVGKDHEAVFELNEALQVVPGTELTFRLEQTHGGSHLIGRFRLWVTDADPPHRIVKEKLPAEVVSALAVAREMRNEGQRITLAAYVLEQQLQRELAVLPKPRLAYVASNQIQPDGSHKPTARPRPIHLLQRGDVHHKGEEVGPGTLGCLPMLGSELRDVKPDDEGSRRVALARWLSDHENVLTWRSIVNRIWHYHFGRGIVATPNDFGRLGEAPSHLELLDWLALELQGNGGSLKKLHKVILLSATYRQVSDHDPRAYAIDGENRYLWRMHRTRLDAESVRDAILMASGKLDRTMGGPSVQQFTLSPGLHVTPVVDYGAFDVDHPSNYRRSVYRFLFRTIPDPFMDALDCPDASQFTPVRSVSVTPPQALAMLNNKFVIRQSEHLAARAQAGAADVQTQIQRVYAWTLGRAPTDQERHAMTAHARQHGLANVCRLLLNCNEFVFVN